MIRARTSSPENIQNNIGDRRKQTGGRFARVPSLSYLLFTFVALLGLGAMVTFAPSAYAQQAPDGDEPVMLVADELEYDQENDLIIARGNVEVIQGEQILMADEITVFQRENRIRADGNIVLVQPGGQVIFGRTAELTNDFSEGFVRAISVLLADDMRIAAVSGQRVGGVELELNRVVASPCRECSGNRAPLWQIKASRVTHNSETGNVIYRHARFELFGVPVFYTPFLSHPDPTVRRRTGLLAPSIGSNADLGLTIRTPLFVTLGPSADILFDPMATSRETALITGEFRKRFNNGQFRLRTGVTKERQASDRIRSHLDTEFNFDVNDYWRFGGDIKIASDDTFLDRYGIDSSDTLRSHLYAEGFTSRNYATIEARSFQGLERADDQGITPIVAPNIDIALIGQPQYFGNFLGGRYEADLNIQALTSEQSIDSQRLSISGGWELPITGLIGDLTTIEASVRGDLYHIENSINRDTMVPFDGIRGRFRPQLKIDWRLPLVRSVSRNIQQFIEPVGQLVIAPNGVNDANIPNQDSTLFELDETSLFSGNRFPGLDVVEDGKHFSFGVNFGVFGLGGGTATAFIGQSFQFRENRADLTGTGIEDSFSDYVVRVDLAPTRYIDLLWKARLDKDTLEARRIETQGNVGLPIFNVGFNYLFFEPIDEFPEREEITATLRSQLNDRWSAGAEWRSDLTSAGDTIYYGASLRYTCDCLDAEIAWRREFTRDRDVAPETTIFLKATLKHLGQLQSQVF